MRVSPIRMSLPWTRLFELLKAALGERAEINVIVGNMGKEGYAVPANFATDIQAFDTFFDQVKAAASAKVVDPWAAKVAELEPISKGGVDGASWHAALDIAASLTDCIDLAMVETTGLFALPNYEEHVTVLKTMEKDANDMMGVFGLGVDAELVKRSEELRWALLLTRSEQMLLTLYSADGQASFPSADVRDTKTRQIRTLCGGVRRFKNVFKPIYQKASEAMKGK